MHSNWQLKVHDELNIDFFKVSFDRIAPDQGKILIAQPTLIDMNFKRSVILLVEHNKNGTVGFVLNRLLELTLPELLPDFPDLDVKISIGGPVSPNSIHFIHTLGERIPGAVTIGKSLFWGGDFESLKAMIISGKVKSHQVRFFVGYSGWGVKQLEREISEESWVVAQTDPNSIMKGSDDLWTRVLQQMGKQFKLWTLYPENPSLN